MGRERDLERGEFAAFIGMLLMWRVQWAVALSL